MNPIGLNDLDKLQLVSDVSIHAKLLSNLHISTNELMEAKNMLEAIGLLKTYIKGDTVNNYIYELYSPVSAHEFFSHPIFNIVLYNNIGKKEYDKLVLCFKMPKINKDGYTEVTHSFTEIFDSVPYTSSNIFFLYIVENCSLKYLSQAESLADPSFPKRSFCKYFISHKPKLRSIMGLLELISNCISHLLCSIN